LGELLSLLCALVWAVAVIFFKKSGESVHPIALNSFKNSVAILLFIPTIFILEGGLPPDVPLEDYLLLLASGAIGIAAADTLFFQALNILGASLTAIVDCLYVPFVVLCSMAMLGDSITATQAGGIALILTGIIVSTSGSWRRKNSPTAVTSGPAPTKPLPPKRLALGIILGTLSMFGMAFGIVMVKPQVEAYPVVWVSEMRMLGGMLALAVMLAFNPNRKTILGTLKNPRGRKFALAGAFVGGYLAMMIWVAGMKFADASIAAALNQTSNLFIFILAFLFLREPLTPPRVAGILAGVAGVVVILTATA